MFKRFKVLAENQSKKRIKVLRTDAEDEYSSKVFEAFCVDLGIQIQ